MTLSSQEISDRLEIQELIAQFSHAVDNRRWSTRSPCSRPTRRSTTR